MPIIEIINNTRGNIIIFKERERSYWGGGGGGQKIKMLKSGADLGFFVAEHREGVVTFDRGEGVVTFDGGRGSPSQHELHL